MSLKNYLIICRDNSNRSSNHIRFLFIFSSICLVFSTSFLLSSIITSFLALLASSAFLYEKKSYRSQFGSVFKVNDILLTQSRPIEVRILLHPIGVGVVFLVQMSVLKVGLGMMSLQQWSEKILDAKLNTSSLFFIFH